MKTVLQTEWEIIRAKYACLLNPLVLTIMDRLAEWDGYDYSEYPHTAADMRTRLIKTLRSAELDQSNVMRLLYQIIPESEDA